MGVSACEKPKASETSKSVSPARPGPARRISTNGDAWTILWIAASGLCSRCRLPKTRPRRKKAKAVKRPVSPVLAPALPPVFMDVSPPVLLPRLEDAIFALFSGVHFPQRPPGAAHVDVGRQRRSSQSPQRVRFFPVLPPVLPPGTRMTLFSRCSTARISPEFGFPRRFR